MPRAKKHVLDTDESRKPKNDLTGQSFQRWTVISFAGRDGWIAYWNCKCSCGTEMVVQDGNLKSGKTSSCGCHREELQRARIIHGLSRRGKRRSEYTIWANMLQRTTNPNNEAWDDYGGRGITVCDEWRTFSNFYADMGDRPSKLFTIGRINNDLGYCPSNCRWELDPEQRRNKRNNVLMTYKGETLCRHEMAAKYGIRYFTLRSRIRSGMTVEEAIETPIFKGKELMKRKRQTKE